jgi:acyl-CoA thioesterase-1
LGDSLTAGYGIDQEKAFPRLIEQALAKEGIHVQVINAGISGSTTASAVSRIKWQLKSPPALIVLALGGNDGLRGLPPESSSRHLQSAIELAKAQNVQVLLAGMQMPPNYGADYTKRFASIYPELATKLSVPLIPFLLEGVGGEPQYNQPDGIHPNEAGHQRIADHILTFIKPLLKAN